MTVKNIFLYDFSKSELLKNHPKSASKMGLMPVLLV